MVVVPSAHYCIVDSPALRSDNLVAFDEVGQARLRHGEREVRLHQPPFPLYPGETLAGEVRPLPVIRAGQALRLRALQDTVDSEGTRRWAGDEWMVTKKGAYVPAVWVEVVETVEFERVTLTDRQYCVLCAPGADDKPQRRVLKGPLSFFLQPGESLQEGIQDIRFLGENEVLDLTAREAFTDETVTPAVRRSHCSRWTVRGPLAEFIPPVESKVLRQHSLILLCQNEGVYVQNTVTGDIRIEMGKPYLLTAEEQLWSKKLSYDAGELLARYRNETGCGVSYNTRTGMYTSAPERDQARVVTYCVPEHRYALVEDHGTGENRTVLGPELVVLQPAEHLRVFSMPGGTPVKTSFSKSLTLPWSSDGAEYLTDQFRDSDKREREVRLAWHMLHGVAGKVPKVAKNGADVAFLDLKNRLHEDAKGNKLKSQYEFGHFAFVYAHQW